MNQICLIGRLARDPELHYTPNAKAVVKVTVAVDRGFGENKQTDWIPVTAWEQTAEFVSNYLEKGSRVAVEGRLQSHTYETKDGVKRTVYEVVAHRIQSLDSKKKEQPQDERGARSRAAAQVQSPGPKGDGGFHDPFEQD